MELKQMLLPFVLALLIRYEYGLPQHPPDHMKALLRCLPVIVLITRILESQNGNDFSLRLGAGMGFAAAGDLCQLYKDEHFTHGVICFGIAYCLYTVAFGLKVDHTCLAALIGLMAATGCYVINPDRVRILHMKHGKWRTSPPYDGRKPLMKQLKMVEHCSKIS
ncbi:lysoplasmalogenase TMEM86B-like isoform X3 [Narcine bancroftii]|uniref:lysoplasmalogenase TMEM86B-like isoform X3 n=1 Tax=Narcine bancroftii TaxID=1343680 RepID=UPI00383152D0